MLLLPLHSSRFTLKIFNTTPYVLCRIFNELGLVFHRAVVKYGSDKENNTQANPFYSPVPECCDKGGLLSLPSVYDYQYVLGHLTIEQTSTGHDRTKTNYVPASSRENIKQGCTPLWHRPSIAESTRGVEWIFV